MGTTSKYIGISYNEKMKRWLVYRWSKRDRKAFSDGWYRDEEAAARASDTLARKFMVSSDQNIKLNFPDDVIEEDSQHQTYKRKRPLEFEYSQANEDNFERLEEKKSGNIPKYRAFLGSGFKNN